MLLFSRHGSMHPFNGKDLGRMAFIHWFFMAEKSETVETPENNALGNAEFPWHYSGQCVSARLTRLH